MSNVSPMLEMTTLRAVPPIQQPKPDPFPERPQESEFPVDHLPATLRDGVQAITDLTQCDPALAAASVLAAASLATQPLADVQTLSGQASPLSLFFLTLAASGERKSTVDKHALQAVKEYEAELREENKRVKLAIAKCDPKKEEAPDLPPPPILHTSKATMQGVSRLFTEGCCNLGLFSDEGLSFLGGYAMGKDHKLETIADLSTLWGGSPINVVQASKPIEVLPGKRLACHLMIQPDYGLAFINGKDTQHQGLAGRMLVSQPKSNIGSRLYKEPSADTPILLAHYNNRLGELLHLPQENTEKLPVLTLSLEAKALLVQLHDKYEVEARPGGPVESIQPFALKIAEHAARIAGVFQMVMDSAARVIQANTMRDAIGVAEFYLREALRLAHVGDEEQEERQARTLYEKLKAKAKEQPIVYISWIIQNIRVAGVKGKDALMPLIRELVERGNLVPCEPGFVVDGAARKEAWMVVLC